MQALAARKLSKTYCTGLLTKLLSRSRPPVAPALDRLDLCVEPGEVVGLLGPNGAGKTTTIGLALGLLRPSAGEVRLFGKDPRQRAARASVGYLPETSAFSRKLTGRELVTAFGRLRGRSRREARQEASEMLARVGMAEAPDRTIGQLSKGMARRIGLAAALVGGPSFLILDEPTSGLDPVGRRAMKDLFLELKQEGRTLLISSHLLAEVEDVCDRIALLDRGQLLASGRLSELLTHGKNRVLVTRGLGENERAALGDRLISETAQRESLEAFFVRTVTARNGQANTRQRESALAPAPTGSREG